MEDSTQISSPPYPGGVTRIDTLYRYLAALRLWLVEQQEALRLLVPPKHAAQLKEPDNLAAETVWGGVSVVDHYTVLMYLRMIREGWDHVIREHEDTWDSKLALKKRFALAVMAQHVLDEAFISPELREARNQTAMDTILHELKARQDKLKELMNPSNAPDEDKPGQETEDDDEDWFLPTDHEPA